MKSSSRKSLLVANWKMNKTPDDTIRYVERLHSKVGQCEAVDVFIAPPFVALDSANRALRWSKIKLAAQDISEFESGAYTGEVSANMLLTIGCHGVIIGHSERRRIFGDSDERVGLKVIRALCDGLFPIICIGETAKEREEGKTEKVLSRQVAGALSGIAEERELFEKSDFALAYEPVWAIGTGKAATPEMAESAHKFIRDRLGETAGKAKADNVRIIYGGSVNSVNSKELLAQENIDGALIGGASLEAMEFMRIIETAPDFAESEVRKS